MKVKLAIFLLVTTSATPALAADIAANSRVDAVTVFPSGAEVTRAADTVLEPGEHTLIFDDLPGDLMPETVRVEGQSGTTVEIGSVDTKLTVLPSTAVEGQRKSLTSEIEALTEERRRLDQVVADAEYQKGLMQKLASQSFAPAETTDGAHGMDAEALGKLLDLVAGKLEAYSQKVLTAQARQAAIDQAVADLNTALAQLPPQDQARTNVRVHFTADAAGKGQFRLKYRVAGAGWQPVYDARLTTPAAATKAGIELVRRAAVMQSTAESWDGVSLTLSTARPVGATAAPDLAPWQIDGQVFEKREDDANLAGRLVAPLPAAEAVGEVAQDALVETRKNVMQRQAEVQIAGFQALYAVPGRVSVDNSGTAKTVRIDTTMLSAELSALTVPKLDPSAYLTARFVVSGDTPLLPGTVMLYRDGVFMGQGQIPLLSPGEDARLGFGTDDLVRVKRAEVRRLTGEEGLISTSNVDERAYDITVKNLHDFAMPVTVLDQMPYAVREDIKVEELAGMTRPTTRDYEASRGVLAWTVDLAAGRETTIKHGYKLTWPEGMQVGMSLN